MLDPGVLEQLAEAVLMSGGGPVPSCTNPYPDSVEASEVNTLWANGFVAQGSFAKVG